MNEKLKQRLVGAVVLVSLAVIFVPILLDGGNRSGMPMFGSNIPDKPDYEFEPLEIPLQPVPPMAEERPVLLDKPEPTQPEPGPEPGTESETATTLTEAKTETPTAEPETPPVPPQPDPEPQAPAESGTVAGWVVQVGSFSQSSNALELRDKLRSNGFTAFVEKLKSNGDMIYRVRVGPELKRENAEKQLKRLQQKMKIDGLVMGHEG